MNFIPFARAVPGIRPLTKWIARRATNLRSVARALAAALSMAALGVLLTSCGGGVGTGGTGTFAQGPISGFGSIIVNGVKFDESSARVEDDDGGLQSSANLRLGMAVQVQAGPSSTVGAVTSAQASLVRVTRSVVGTVGSVQVAQSRFTVLGQPIVVGPGTAFRSAWSCRHRGGK